jgi:predicted nucleic acid-binding OB-fold protein
MDKPITYDELMKVSRSLMRAVADALVENEATQAVMMAQDPDKPSIALAILDARKEARRKWQPLLDRISEATPDSFEDILRKFDGPLQ